MKIQESGEMYLETILILSKDKPDLHAIDISGYMGFSKPSVSRAIGILKSEGMITVDENQHIRLTEEGREIANKIYERHQVLSCFFEHIGISHETAVDDACRIEHVLHDETFEKLKEYITNNHIADTGSNVAN